jgi:hypothetical protein
LAEKNLVDYSQDDEFRMSYKYMQALAFLPEDDVIDSFILVQQKSGEKFKPILDYLEDYYIGKLVTNSRSVRKEPMFPIPCWNLYNRILTDKARSTNSVEAWHCTITPDSKKKLTLFEVIELFKREQSNSENWITKLETGHVHKTKKRSLQHTQKLK